MAYFRVSPSLVPLGWIPDDRGCPVNTNAEQDYSRQARLRGIHPYPYTIGWIQQLTPLMDIWRYSGKTRIPVGPYIGGHGLADYGLRSFGLESHPMRVPKAEG